MKKMGYDGQGLGKNSQGQTNPTNIDTIPLHASLGNHGGVVVEGECSIVA